MGAIRSYRDLIAWQRSMDLVQAVYALTRTFPKEETYGLSQQLRRAAVSVAANIAEGHGRAGRKAYAHFVSIACGSLAETETLVEVALRLGYLDTPAVQGVSQHCDETGRMLTALRSRLRSSPPGP